MKRREKLKDFVISVDFDDTLFVGKYPDVGSLIKPMVDLINRLYQRGFVITINTCRSTEVSVSNAKEALSTNNINYDLFNENAPYLIDYYQTDTRKISCDIFIDDRNVGGVPTLSYIEREVDRLWKKKSEVPSKLLKVYL